MKQLTRFLLLSILLLSCSKKVKYIDMEAKINIVPLPKSLNLIDPGKHILLSKKIKVFNLGINLTYKYTVTSMGINVWDKFFNERDMLKLEIL